MKKYKSLDGNLYDIHDIKRANSKIIYWVCTDDYIEFKHKNHTLWKNVFHARNLKHAFKLARKYHATEILRMLQSDLGRWCIEEWEFKD